MDRLHLLSLNRLPQAIRTECRKVPAVSKRTLIEIAVKRQERSMLKAYATYRECVNPAKKEKGDPATPAQIVPFYGNNQMLMQKVIWGEQGLFVEDRSVDADEDMVADPDIAAGC